MTGLVSCAVACDSRDHVRRCRGAGAYGSCHLQEFSDKGTGGPWVALRWTGGEEKHGGEMKVWKGGIREVTAGKVVFLLL